MDKILIIDDDRELCALIKRSVQSEHIEADTPALLISASPLFRYYKNRLLYVLFVRCV